MEDEIEVLLEYEGSRRQLSAVRSELCASVAGELRGLLGVEEEVRVVLSSSCSKDAGAASYCKSGQRSKAVIVIQLGNRSPRGGSRKKGKGGGGGGAELSLDWDRS